MAIVLPHGRPALDVAGGTYAPPDAPWAHLDAPDARAHLEAAIRATGRIDLEGAPMPFVGSAFVVGPGLVLTILIGYTLEKLDGAPASALVDFGHEAAPGDSVRVELGELVYKEPRWGAELFRAELPGSIAPLRLSVTEPSELEQIEVALVGYPAVDRRNDPRLMERILPGEGGTKRVSPGRILGPAERGYPGTDPTVVAHDCTSAAGSSGGPLVDLESGDVVAVHFAGEYLGANHAIAAYELARDPRFRETGVQLSGDPPEDLPPAPASFGTALEDERSERVGTAGASGWGSGDEAAAIPVSRPSWRVASWRIESGGAWSPVLGSNRDRIDRSLRAVGRLRHGPGPLDWSGTAFLVGDRLAMTASFNVGMFAEGSGVHVRLKDGMEPAVDFGPALQRPAAEATAAVSRVRFIHPYFQVALLELDGMPDGVAQLELAAQVPSQLSGRFVLLLAFALQEEAPHMLLQPGKALQLAPLPGDLSLAALAHDCDSEAGSAGGPVLDVGTGSVIGIHTHGEGVRGFAQPSWELARDPNVWDHPIHFRPDPRPPWLDAWHVPGTQPPGRPAPSAVPDDDRWTVDDVPIDWSREEPRAIEAILVGTVPFKVALMKAENVGMPLGAVETDGAAEYLWRELLKKASTAALLRRLLEEVAADRQYAGIAPKLRAYL